MRVNKWFVPTLALALLLGTVGVAQAAGWWLVSGREMVNLEQLAGGADVKGWMTLQQVADGTGLDTATLYTKLGLPTDISPETALKELEGVVEGFETSTVRTVVDEILGLAPEAGVEDPSHADTAPTVMATATQATIPAAATAAPAIELAATPSPNSATAEPLEAPATAAHTPAGDGTGTGGSEGETRPSVTSAASIKGSHTLQEIVDATGVDLATLLTSLNLPPDIDPHTPLRKLVADGFVSEVDQVRSAVAELQ